MITSLKAHLPELGILIFLIITFGISVIEKLVDWKGTIRYIEHNFKDTFIKKHINILITLLLGLEISANIFLVMGLFQLLIWKETGMALLGVVFSAICILYMLIGQRIAKDYVGATSLTVYFLVTIFGLYLLK